MAKRQGTREGDNGDHYVRRFDWSKVWVAVVTALLASLLTGGTVMGLKLSTSVQAPVHQVEAPDLGGLKQKLESYMDYNDRLMKVQIANLDKEISAVRADQAVMKRTLDKILQRLSKTGK